MSKTPFIVGIGGTTRPNSSSERALGKALAHAESLGAETFLLGGAFIAGLPVYNPDLPIMNADVDQLLETVRRCDGLILASPGYHGSISGLVKNAIDTLEGLSKDARPYFDGRAVGLLVSAAGAQACGSTLAAMRTVVHAMRGWPTPYGATLNSAAPLFDAEGGFADARDAWQVETVAGQVVDFARAFAG